MIIDSHLHLGSCSVFGLNTTEDELMRALDVNNLDAAIIQPYPGAPDCRQVHDRIADLCQANPGRVFGLMSMNPHCPENEFKAEASRCIRELGFKGIKLHTFGHAVSPLSSAADMVFRTAQELGVPVNVHTGTGVPFALPSLCLPIAKRYPDVPAVLAHAGYAVYTAEALIAAQYADNVFLETSWCQIQNIAGFINSLGASRVLFGSDLTVNIPVEKAKYESLKIDSEVRERCLATNAIEIFSLTIG